MNNIKRIFLIIIAVQIFACMSDTKKTYGRIEMLDPALDSIIDKNAAVEIIAEGFEWSEGPLWLEAQQQLIFSDVPANTIYKWTAATGKQVYLTPSGYTGSIKRGGEVGSNGLILNTKGQLVLCQHGDRRIAIMNAPLDHPQPQFIPVADHFMGKKFDSPNDVICRSNGDLFFTDPPYGLENNVNDKNKEAPYQGVYKVSSNGTVTLLTDTITRPNGLVFLPGEKTLLIANSDPDKACWYAFDVSASDSLVNMRIFYDAQNESKKETGLPDGMKVDKEGNVFATGPGGVWIFDVKGKLLGKIKTDGVVSNCAIAADHTLYITADMYVLRVKLLK